MAQGRLQAERQTVLAQAAVLFFDGRDEDIEEFIATGYLPGNMQSLPYNPAVLEQMQRDVDARRLGSS